MQGNNELKLCKADMMTAVEYWLNQVLLREPVTVTDVRENGSSGDYTFSVKIKTPEKPPEKPGHERAEQ